MKNCANCTFARQRGKLDDQNIVGCAILYFNEDTGTFESQLTGKEISIKRGRRILQRLVLFLS